MGVRSTPLRLLSNAVFPAALLGYAHLLADGVLTLGFASKVGPGERAEGKGRTAQPAGEGVWQQGRGRGYCGRLCMFALAAPAPPKR